MLFVPFKRLPPRQFWLLGNSPRYPLGFGPSVRVSLVFVKKTEKTLAPRRHSDPRKLDVSFRVLAGTFGVKQRPLVPGVVRRFAAL